MKTRKKLKNRRGNSISEMLFCLVIIGLISILACTCLLTAYRVVSEINDAAYAQTVCDTILEKITGELMDAAKGDMYLGSDNGEYPVIAFSGSSGVPMYICATENIDNPSNSLGKGELLVYYCETEGAGNAVASSRWTFDRGMYMGYTIKKLTFEKKERSGKPVIEVNLEIVRSVDGAEEEKTYESSAAVCCFNLQSDNCLNDKFTAKQIAESENFYKLAQSQPNP